MCRSAGSTYARVLPDPVLAMPITSRPDMMAGRACAWMGMGPVKPSFRSVSRMDERSPHWFQLRMGLGMSLPRTCRCQR